MADQSQSICLLFSTKMMRMLTEKQKEI